MNIAKILTSTATTAAQRPAVSFGRKQILNYAELAERSLSLAAGITDCLGLKMGDHVALIMKNCPEYIEILFGLWSAGISVVPINTKLHQNEFSFILDHSQSRICFCSPGLVDILTPLVPAISRLEAVISVGEPAYDNLFTGRKKGVVEELEPHNLAWLFYTSGTTGRPKGAMLTHRNLDVMLNSHLADIDDIGEQDCCIHAAPLSHGSGMYVLPHIARGANNVIPESGGFNTQETLELLSHYHGCSAFFAPTMLHRLIQDPAAQSANLNGLKNIVYGGGPMYLEDLKKALSILGPRLSQIYGQGEAPMTITGLTRDMHTDHETEAGVARLKSVGVPRSGVVVKVFDEEAQELPPGEIGEVVCRGDIVMAGYWRNLEATAETLKSGWLHTGDVGFIDQSGFLTLKDRSKDMIISGGTNIYPREVEEVLLQHPDVQEASVVGRLDPDWGETVVAFIVPSEGSQVDTDDLDTFCIDHIARFKRPKTYHIVDSLPKNNTGKILKIELRKLLKEKTDEICNV